jgi:hypothetical protein
MVVDVPTRPSTEERIRAALWFSERGFGVFSVWSTDPNGECRCPASSKTRGADGRCSSPGKHPIPPKGFLEATTDESRIRTMLSAASEPNYGLLPPPGVFVLDVDDDGDGIVRLARLEALYGPLPPTLRTETRNGQHIFLRWPDRLPRPVHKMFGYVTRWGTGSQAGYVIGPRSVHASGFTYAPMVGAFEIAVLPDRWAQAAIAGEDTRLPVGKELPKRGGRHDWLRDRARYYRGVMDDKAVLKAAVMAENARLEEPKTEEEVDRAIGEVFEKFPVDEPETVDGRVSRRLRLDELDMLGLPAWGEFPQAPDEAAFGGILGQLVGNLAEGTDASLVGLLGSVLAVAGAVIPARAYFHREHTSSPFITLVGESSVGRKGTAMNRALDAFRHAVSIDTVNRLLLDGLNSGEGLVSALDYQKKIHPQEPAVGLVFEEEYATLIASRGREGSTLDAKMRLAFDGGSLSNRKASETKTVLPPYWLPALVAITPIELKTRAEAGGLQSGSMNRWLHLPVVRRKLEPALDLPKFSDRLKAELVDVHRRAVNKQPRLDVDPAVQSMLSGYADFLAENAIGLAADLTKRFPVIAFRIALIHALVEGSAVVGHGHLIRALALTEYARQGIPWVFGDTIGDKEAAYLYRQLVDAGRLTQTAITRNLIRDPIRRQGAIDELIRIKRARLVEIQTGGRNRRELEPLPALAPTFFPFFHLTTNRHKREPETLEIMEKREKSAQGPWKKGGKKVEERGDGMAERGDPETVSCHFYREHQTRHEYRDGRWMCPICEQPSPAA